MVLRRILWLVAALLLVTAVTSALAPRDDEPTATEPLPRTTAPREDRALIERRIDADGEGGATVRARVEDHVRLEVRSSTVDNVVFQGLDRREVVSPENPARFDVVVNRPGRFPLRLEGGERDLAVLLVSDEQGSRG